MEPRKPTPLDDFLFDLRGYLVLESAVEAGLLDGLNRAFDSFPDIELEEWWGNAQRRDYTKNSGYELHNCVEAGEPFERLIDHPSWIDYVRHYCGEEGSYLAPQGVFIDECIASIRRTGGDHPLHSGGYRGAVRGAYNYNNGVFRCGQANIIVALTDIHEGDGPTVVVPGSHKSNLPHPHPRRAANAAGDAPEGTLPVHMNKGDALLFVDGLMHGGSSRTNPGERRIVIYRYGPSWGTTRYGYEYSQALLDRLTPERSKILRPVSLARPTVAV